MNTPLNTHTPMLSISTPVHVFDSLSDTPLILDGFLRNRRHLVLIGDKQVWLTNLSFRTLLKLAIAAHSKPHGWLEAHNIGNGTDHHQVICRLRKDLQKAGVDAKSIVENSGTSDYRLAVMPDKISYDATRIGQLVLYASIIFQEFSKPAA